MYGFVGNNPVNGYDYLGMNGVDDDNGTGAGEGWFGTIVVLPPITVGGGDDPSSGGFDGDFEVEQQRPEREWDAFGDYVLEQTIREVNQDRYASSNGQSGYRPPQLPDGITISGGGRNEGKNESSFFQLPRSQARIFYNSIRRAHPAEAIKYAAVTAGTATGGLGIRALYQGGLNGVRSILARRAAQLATRQVARTAIKPTAEAGIFILEGGGGSGVVTFSSTALSVEQASILTGSLFEAAYTANIARNVIAIEMAIEATYTYFDPGLPLPTPGGMIGWGAQQIATPEELVEYLNANSSGQE